MTLKNFLSHFPDMDKIRAIPVPVEGNNVEVIESLVHNSSLSNLERDHLLSELDELLAERSARKIKGGKFDQLQPLTVRPRGGGAGPRFFGGGGNHIDSVAPVEPLRPFPELQFGFTPVVTPQPPAPKTPFFSPTPIHPVQLAGTAAPLLSTLSDVDQKEAFFFTTTEAPKASEETDRSSRKSTLGFDMRNLFYIPPEKKKQPKSYRTFFSP